MSQRAHRPIPISIQEQYTEENIKSTKHILWKRQRVFDHKITTNNYEDSLIFDARLYARKLIQIINHHASNALSYIVMACIDPKHWETIKTASTLNGGSTVTLDHNDITNLNSPWAYIKIQIKSNVADTPAECTAFISGMTP